MKVVRVYRLNNLSLTCFRRLEQAQMVMARVWNECMGTHKQALLDHLTWPNKRTLRVKWPAQAIHQEKERVVLPMGRGHPSFVMPLTLPEGTGASTLG